MTPGSILHDTQFRFSDGTLGNKLLIVLNDGQDGSYIFIKTTSKQKRKNKTPGCQRRDRPPNFFLPKGSCWFDLDTWAELSEFFEADLNSLLKKQLAKTLLHRDILPDGIVKDLLACAVSCDDITKLQEQRLTAILQSLP
jgi:hypothetical protein